VADGDPQYLSRVMPAEGNRPAGLLFRGRCREMRAGREVPADGGRGGECQYLIPGTGRCGFPAWSMQPRATGQPDRGPLAAAGGQRGDAAGRRPSLLCGAWHPLGMGVPDGGGVGTRVEQGNGTGRDLARCEATAPWPGRVTASPDIGLETAVSGADGNTPDFLIPGRWPKTLSTLIQSGQPAVYGQSAGRSCHSRYGALSAPDNGGSLVTFACRWFLP